MEAAQKAPPKAAARAPLLRGARKREAPLKGRNNQPRSGKTGVRRRLTPPGIARKRDSLRKQIKKSKIQIFAIFNDLRLAFFVNRFFFGT